MSPSLSLSPTPPLLQRQPLSLSQRKGVYLQKKSPVDMKRSGPGPGKAKRSPQRGSGPVHFNSCTFTEDHKKGPSPALGLCWGGGGGMGGRPPLGECGEANPESCLKQPLGLASLPVGKESRPWLAPRAPPHGTSVLVGGDHERNTQVVLHGNLSLQVQSSPEHHLHPLPATLASIPRVCAARALSLGATQCGDGGRVTGGRAGKNLSAPNPAIAPSPTPSIG